MVTKRTLVPAAKFKAQCLSLLDAVERTGKELTITKRGRPVARLVPLDAPSKGSLVGSAQELGDIIGPFHEWWEET